VLLTKKLMTGLTWALSAPILCPLSLLTTPSAAIAARRKICCFISKSLPCFVALRRFSSQQRGYDVAEKNLVLG
jgi:hypothetical protein